MYRLFFWIVWAMSLHASDLKNEVGFAENSDIPWMVTFATECDHETWKMATSPTILSSQDLSQLWLEACKKPWGTESEIFFKLHLNHLAPFYGACRLETLQKALWETYLSPSQVKPFYTFHLMAGAHLSNSLSTEALQKQKKLEALWENLLDQCMENKAWAYFEATLILAHKFVSHINPQNVIDHFLMKSALQGYAPALYQQAFGFLRTKNQTSYKKALECFQRAAAQGYPLAWKIQG